MIHKKPKFLKPTRQFEAPQAIKELLDDPVTVAIAAKIIGISKVELNRRAREGIYGPVADHRKWWWFSRTDLEKMMRKAAYESSDTSSVWANTAKMKERAAQQAGVEQPLHDSLSGRSKNGSKPGPKPREVNSLTGRRDRGFSGEAAKRVFHLLIDNKSNIEIVMELGLHPEVVESIEASWHRLKGGLYLTPEAKNALERLPLQGELPIVDGEHLIKVLQNTLGLPSPCAKCGAQKARLCIGCAQLSGQQSHQNSD